MSIAPSFRSGFRSVDDAGGVAGVGVGDCATGGVGWDGHRGASAAHPVDAMADRNAKVTPFDMDPKVTPFGIDDIAM
jgi:hypothetical protein